MTVSHPVYESLLDSLTQFISYIESGNEQQLISYMDTRSKKFMRDFCVIRIGTDETDGGIKEKTRTLFNTLDTKQSWFIYYEPEWTVLKFLKEVQKHHKSKKRLAFLIKQIEKKLAYTKLQLAAMALGFIGVVLAVIFVPPIQEAVLSAALDLTILALVYSSITALYKFRQIYCNMNKSLREMISDRKFLRDTAFLLTSTVLNVTAYGLWMAASGILSPMVAGIFITGSVVDVLKEFYLVIINYRNRDQCRKSHANLSQFELSITNKKNEFDYTKHLHAALINLLGALLIASLIATWCFIPGSTPTTIAMIAAMFIVQIIKNCMLNCSNKRNERLRMEELCTMKDPDPRPNKKDSENILSPTPSRNNKPPFQGTTEPFFAKEHPDVSGTFFPSTEATQGAGAEFKLKID